MKRIHRATAVFAALIGALVFGLTACTADTAPSAPRAPALAAADVQPPSDLLGLDQTLSGLSSLTLYQCATPSFGAVTKRVGPAGGTISIGPHSLVIPAGALDRTVEITASTHAASHVRVDFQPEGLQFGTSATLRLSYAHCPAPPLLPKVVYVDELLSILEVLPSLNDLSNREVSARLRHFSGYAIAD